MLQASGTVAKMALQDLSKEEALKEFQKLVLPMALQSSVTHLPFRVPFFVTSEVLEELASFALDPSDVFIVTYPKAGTTWTQQIVKLLRSNGEKDGVELQQSVPWAEANSDKNILKVDLSSMPKPRAFKSHMTYETMPCGRPDKTPCKYIFVIRNPKDTAVSFYYHIRRLGLKRDANLEWDLYFRNFIYGNFEFGDFFDHALSWWPHRNDENVLFLRFEEMKKDPRLAVTRIAKFIEADVSDEVIDKVVAETSFDAMKKDKTANYSYTDSFATPGATPFMRKGVVGDWKNYFTPEQSAEIDKICAERLKGTGLVFDFGE